MKPMRINKFLSRRGVCSRREADRMIKNGRITVNDKSATLGQSVTDVDDIRIDGKPVDTEKPEPVYLIFHKPVGLITTTNTDKPDNVISYIDYPERIFPIGRLDVASSGLLLLTNDGTLANRIMHPRYEHEKEYVVTVDRPISDRDLKHLAAGVDLEDGTTAPAQTKRIGKQTFTLTLREGRNRQIRRMCGALHYDVEGL